jgi:four helix bundle protein
MKVVTKAYEISRKFPKDEVYGLTQQLRRCAVSVPSNIAEGYGRKSTNDYLRFLQIAIGSLYEMQTQMEIALNLGYVGQNEFNSLSEDAMEIERMLCILSSKIQVS